MPIQIVLVDDHTLLRQGLRMLLEQQQNMKVIGEASNGRDAIGMVRQLAPHVVVMDISMPQLNGIDAARQITRDFPMCKVLGLSAYGDQKTVSEALRAGLAGYMLKDVAMEELAAAVQAVYNGQTYLSPKIARVVVSEYVNGGNGSTTLGDHPPRSRLTPREREVLQLTAEGKALKEVATVLGISVKTVETHRRSIMEKLQLFSVAELTKHAVREGLTTLEI